MSHLVTVIHIDESADNPHGLGRHVEHDDRSLSYPFSLDLVAGFASTKHERAIPVLDQGQVGSCTGNAAEGCAGTAPFFAAIPEDLAVRPSETDADVDEEQAVALYTRATELDSVPGTYPDQDTGSTGLAAAKATKQAGLIAGYQHAFGLDAVRMALTATPLITGVPWYDSMFDPQPDGEVRITKSASIAGGHEFVLDEVDEENKRIWATNSWGTGWAADGRFYMTFDTYGRLLDENGDATVLVPLTDDPPDPTPTPTPDEVDAALNAAWRKFRVATHSWRAAKGFTT